MRTITHDLLGQVRLLASENYRKIKITGSEKVNNIVHSLTKAIYIVNFVFIVSRFYFSEEVSPRGKRQKSIFRIDNEDLKEKRTEDKGGKIDSNDKSDCSSGSDIIPDNADDIDKCGESIGSNSTVEKGDVFVKCGESSGSRISAEKASLIDKSCESSGSEITPEKAGLIDKSGESSGTEITPEKAAVIDNSGDSIRSNNTLKRVNLIHADGNFDIAVKIRNDQDGDIVVKRRKRKVDCSVITIGIN